MTIENFTTYTEVDPNSHIALVGTNHVDFQDYRNESAYLYKDMGSGHFTNFTHLIDIKRFSTSQASAEGAVWTLSNYIGDLAYLYNNHRTYICVYVRSTNLIRLQEYYYDGQDHWAEQSYTGTTNTWYYLKIVKSGTSLTCYIYSDSARTNLVATLSLTLHGDYNFEYIYASQSENTGNTYHGDTDIENLDLQEGGGQTYNVYVDTISQTLSTPAYQTDYGIVKEASVSSQADKTPETAFSVRQDAITQALASVIVEVVSGVIEIFKDAVTTAQAVFSCESAFNIGNDAMVVAVSVPLIESVFGISSDAVVRVVAEVSVAKEGEVKVTRLFLVLGDLAVQLTGD